MIRTFTYPVFDTDCPTKAKNIGKFSTILAGRWDILLKSAPIVQSHGLYSTQVSYPLKNIVVFFRSKADSDTQ